MGKMTFAEEIEVMFETAAEKISALNLRLALCWEHQDSVDDDLGKVFELGVVFWGIVGRSRNSTVVENDLVFVFSFS